MARGQRVLGRARTFRFGLQIALTAIDCDDPPVPEQRDTGDPLPGQLPEGVAWAGQVPRLIDWLIIDLDVCNVLTGEANVDKHQDQLAVLALEVQAGAPQVEYRVAIPSVS